MSETVSAERAVVIQNTYGLHARPAAEFVKAAHVFEADIWVRKEDLEVNGKSIMGMMMLAAERGAEIVIRATGSDAEEAVDRLCMLVDERFGEE
ncbi:MAG TPA: HPr family phosphocarrier protein [Longimicrobiales bacterium]|nr:HPr family phosphocarrier protein [Longimicrobiales bacterium]